MVTSDLFNSVLLHPDHLECDQLVIVSGYATAPIVYKHLQEVEARRKKVEVHLLVGMCRRDGLSRSSHEEFKKLSEEGGFPFHCKYVTSGPPVHAKLYVWLKDGKPRFAYMGSANYTNQGFGKNQLEVLSPSDPLSGYAYYQSLLAYATNCQDDAIESLIPILEEVDHIMVGHKGPLGVPNGPSVMDQPMEEPFSLDKKSLFGLPTCTLSLLDKRTGEVPTRSGLNWGQRPGREPNQAYLNIPAAVGKSNFFPERGVHFTVVPLEDPRSPMVCVRAQDGGKALETSKNNSLLGLYFRERVGLAPGAYVSTKELEAYGRTEVTFYKLDEETYLMDFSK